MTPIYIILSAISLSFCYTEYVNPKINRRYPTNRVFNFKPFVCLTCMSGWFALLIGLIVYGWLGFLFLPVGVFFGAMFSAIKMRYL